MCVLLAERCSLLLGIPLTLSGHQEKLQWQRLPVGYISASACIPSNTLTSHVFAFGACASLEPWARLPWMSASLFLSCQPCCAPRAHLDETLAENGRQDGPFLFSVPISTPMPTKMWCFRGSQDPTKHTSIFSEKAPLFPSCIFICCLESPGFPGLCMNSSYFCHNFPMCILANSLCSSSSDVSLGSKALEIWYEPFSIWSLGCSWVFCKSNFIKIRLTYSELHLTS